MNSPTQEDIALIQKAHDFALKAHDGHKRLSGEPYFNHLFATAKSIAELRMGPITISAGLLHDTIEDVGIKPELLERSLGKKSYF